MSKITQIEQALIRCSPDMFADLCRQYLGYRFENVYASGFVKGKQKSKKGTPDNFIIVKDYFIFNEVTTQAQKLQEKLTNDIGHCFNQKDIPKERIIKIILMCNSEVSPLLSKELIDHKNSFSKGIELEIISIDLFAEQIHKSYPTIARELGIPIDTGQILDVKDFISQYEKSQFSTILTNQFFNREKEIEQSLNYLSKSDILLITGDAGVGKTKFSIELLEKFKKDHSEYHLKFVRNNANLDIWDDLQIQLKKNAKYIIVLDDANKLKQNLEQIIYFISGRKLDEDIKLILTVRNYVKSEVERYTSDFHLIELKKFNKNELENILKSSEFNISDYYVDRIYSISKGNPRIAIMAAVAGLNKDIEKLHNASEIYESYFYSVKKSISSFEDENLLKSAGILAMFTTIDIRNTKQIKQINSYFEIEREYLLESLKKLHQFEIADEFENIYKISDQILGEYLFYLVFIKQQSIFFYTLLKIFLDDKYFPLVKILHPIAQNYGFENVKTFILSDLKRVWTEITNQEDKLRFLKSFWFYLPTETLSFIGSIYNETSQPNFKGYSIEIYEKDSGNVYDDIHIEILINFQQFPKYFQLSLQVLHNYCLSNNVLFTKLLKVFRDSFTYSEFSLENKYIIQTSLFDFLYSKLEIDEEFYSKIILFIAPYYLIDHYNCNSFSGNTFTLNSKLILLTNEQKEFRTKLWEFIFENYSNNRLRLLCQNLIVEYTNSLSHYNHNKDVIKFDKSHICKLIEQKFDNNNIIENMLVDNYSSMMRILEINLDQDLLSTHIGYKFNLYLTFQDDKLKGRDYDGDFDSYEEYKENEILEFIKEFSIDDYKKILADLDSLYSIEHKVFKSYFSLNKGIGLFFKSLAKKDFDVFFIIFQEFLNYKFSNEIWIGSILKDIDYNRKRINQFRNLFKNNYSYISFLWNGMTNEQFIKEDYILFKKLINQNETKSFNFLSKYLKNFEQFIKDKHFEIIAILNILFLRIINDKIQLGEDFFFFIEKEYPSIFKLKLEEIKSVYLILDKEDKYFDYDLELLLFILQKEPKFIVEILKNHFDSKYYLLKRDLRHNKYHMIWEMDNHKEIMFHFLNFIKKYTTTSDYNAVVEIFKGKDEKEVDFLKAYLESSNKKDAILLVNYIVVAKYNDLRFIFLELILKKNITLELFERLDFYTLSTIYSGSRIPRLRYAITEMEKVITYLQSLNNIRYLTYISILEDRIINRRSHIKSELKSEFIEKYGL